MTVEVLPNDSWNADLVRNVHPSDWINPTPKGRYNLVVIGAGTAGLVTAAGAAGLGAKVALVERHLLGGDCLNYGCVPSKAVISAAKTAATARGGHEHGVHTDGLRVDFSAVMERMRRLRSGISRHDSAKRFTDLGVDVYLGEARFVGDGVVEVGGQHLEYAKAVIATGARAWDPPIEGLADTGYYNNESIFSLTELPPEMVVIGSGPIGCEMAQTFQRLGCRVTVVEQADHVLPREDADAAAVVHDAMKKDGVEFLFHAKVVKSENVDGRKRVHIERGGKAETRDTDAILVAVGRAPNVGSLNLEAVKVSYDTRRGVKVDDTLRTDNPKIYAAGDVCMEYKFTHAADFAARAVIRNTLFSFLPKSKLSSLVVPWCTYTEPEVAHVGLSEHAANEKGVAVDTYTVQMADVDRAILEGEDTGFLKVHCAQGSDKILGATMVSSHAGESIGEIVLAMNKGIGLGTIANVIHPYPTQAEAIRKAGDLYNKTRLTPLVARLFKMLIAWQR